MGGCTVLASVNLNNLISIEFIDYYFLADCKALAEFDLPIKDPTTITFGKKNSNIYFMDGAYSKCNLYAATEDLAAKYIATSP